MTIDYAEIRLWIDNDEALYTAWKASRLPVSRFIRENRAELIAYIKKAIGRD